MLIIDCHAHIVSPDEKRYQPKDRPLRSPSGKASVEDLRRVSQANGVRAVRAIHTVSFYGYDNRYLCDSAKANRSWLRGVCALDPDDPHSPGLLRQFAREYGVASLRSVPSPSHKTGFDDAGVRALWRVSAEEGLTIDIFLMRLEMVPSATKLLAEFPNMTVGFCHCMDLKPGPLLAPSLEAVLKLSRFRSLYPKLDFIGTGTQRKFPCEDLHEPCLKIINAYGPERCVWTSCFPNDLWTPKITYSEHLRIFSEVLPLTTEARRQILGETARRLWLPEWKE
ncbi:MAG TPA: amidohydrolase family protein [Bryobacterales bacterium]|nr:amidohydrolase family protein [Bryobacterales bacterium]